MDEYMKTICQVEDARVVTIEYSHKFKCFHSYIHWEDPSLGFCASGSGLTAEQAVSSALENMRTKRHAEAA